MRPGEVANFFLDLERENSLFDWNSDGVYVWQLCRVNIFLKVLAQLKNESAGSKRSFISRLLNKRFQLKNILFHNPFNDKKTSKILIFESSRYTEVNGEFVDPYTSFFVNELKAKGCTLTRYQSNYSTDYLSKKTNEVRHLDYIEYNTLKKVKTRKVSLRKDDTEKIKNLEERFSEKLKIKIELEEFIINSITYFNIEKEYYKKLLQLKNPEKIYLVDYNSKMALISAAKEKGIEVTEMQHGVMVKDDIIYHYPSIKEGTHRYFPDKFIVWNEIWKKSCKLPISSANISIRPNDLLGLKKENLNRTGKITNQIFIASQYDLTNEIAEEVLAGISKLSNYKIIYKLHPVEYPELDRNKNFKKLKEFDNVFFPPANSDLHKYLAESEYFVGVYTFVIFEALEFNCKINLMELPGIEMMSFLKENSGVVFHKNFEEFTSKLLSNS